MAAKADHHDDAEAAEAAPPKAKAAKAGQPQMDHPDVVAANKAHGAGKAAKPTDED